MCIVCFGEGWEDVRLFVEIFGKKDFWDGSMF